jgi:hypothetical protein
MQQLINEARYCPEDIALRNFLRTKEVGLEQLQRALKKVWDKEVCQVAMKGARISTAPLQGPLPVGVLAPCNISYVANNYINEREGLHE